MASCHSSKKSFPWASALAKVATESLRNRSPCSCTCFLRSGTPQISHTTHATMPMARSVKNPRHVSSTNGTTNNPLTPPIASAPQTRGHLRTTASDWTCVCRVMCAARSRRSGSGSGNSSGSVETVQDQSAILSVMRWGRCCRDSATIRLAAFSRVDQMARRAMRRAGGPSRASSGSKTA